MLRKTRSLIFLPGHMPKKTRAPLWRWHLKESNCRHLKSSIECARSHQP